MNKPKPFVRVIKLVKYFLSSIKMISIIQNWFVMPLGVFGIWDFSKGEILKLKNGLKFFATDYMDGWTINEVFGDNDYKIHFSNKPATIIDIGANIGTFSILVAYKMPKAKILSYEPGRKAFLQLRENILLNEMGGRVFPNKLAVYKNKSSIKLYDSGRTGLGSVYRVRGEKKFEVVKTTTLKEIFTKNKIKVCDYLKIDCEGAEYEILNNCPDSIFRRIKTIAMEFHEIVPEYNHLLLVSLLKSKGFNVNCRYHSIENNIGYIYAKK